MRVRSGIALMTMLVSVSLAAPWFGAAGAAGAPSATGTSGAAADPAVAALAKLSGRAFDVAFLQKLLPGDDEAVELAMTATLYADHPELLHWNQDFVERKREGIRRMLSWLQAAGAAPTQRNEGVATPAVRKLRTLRGAALERTYLSLIVSHLDHNVTLARLASQRANETSVRSFAGQLAKADGQDAVRLRSWLKGW